MEDNFVPDRSISARTVSPCLTCPLRAAFVRYFPCILLQFYTFDKEGELRLFYLDLICRGVAVILLVFRGSTIRVCSIVFLSNSKIYSTGEVIVYLKKIVTTAALALAFTLSSVGLHAEDNPFAGNPDLYGHHIAMERMKMMQTMMDKNKDGMISKKEYMEYAEKAAGKGFMMADMDDDGMISKDEFILNIPDLYGADKFIYGGLL